MIRDRAGLDELPDLRGNVTADPRQRQALGPRQPGDATRFMRDGLAGVAVSADLEWILSLDFEQVADFSQDAGDREILHGVLDRDKESKRRGSQEGGVKETH